MRESLRTGIAFGMTSAVITTLGLMVGLGSGTHSRSVVLAGVLTIAIADAFSDALGIHVSEESRGGGQSQGQIWGSTFAAFFAKLLFALTFSVPVLLLELGTALLVSLAWGLLLLTLLSCRIAVARGERRLKIVLEHLTIAVVVIAATHLVGMWISRLLT